MPFRPALGFLLVLNLIAPGLLIADGREGLARASARSGITLVDAVKFFNPILETRLTAAEKAGLVAFLRQL